MNKLIIFLLTLLLSSCTQIQDSNTVSLDENFKSLPPSVRPRTWIYAMSGNFVGDGSPNSVVQRKAINLPNHINYNCINADALINRVTVEDGKIVFPDGLRYQALRLFNVMEIHLSTLKRIAALANLGVIIIGDKPNKRGGYNNTEEEIFEFNRLVEAVWKKPSTYVKIEWDALFSKHDIPIDLMIKNGEDINYIHRKTKDEDIYFFYNPDTKQRTYECTFNVEGKIPELWDQMTGQVIKIAAFEHIDGKTKVAISLPAEGSGFVVFREPSDDVKSISVEMASAHPNIKFYLSENNGIQTETTKNGNYNIEFSNGDSKNISISNLPPSIEISEKWKVTFPDIKAKNKTFDFPALLDWTAHENEEIKYYSGTAIYEKEFDMNENTISDEYKFKLILGEVNVAARIIINKEDMGVVWMSPHTLDITSKILPGKNTLKIEVTNQWTNRLIGDENYPNSTGYDIKSETMPSWYTNNEFPTLGQRSAFTVFPFYKKGDELLPAGLLGPVKITLAKIISI